MAYVGKDGGSHHKSKDYAYASVLVMNVVTSLVLSLNVSVISFINHDYANRRVLPFSFFFYSRFQFNIYN